jgi:hypothetical protein
MLPIVNGCPVELNKHSSVFRNKDFLTQQNLLFNLHPSRLRNFLKRLLPSIDRNLKADANSPASPACSWSAMRRPTS